MPALENSTYHPRWIFRHGHLATVVPTILRSVRDVNWQAERIFTPDHDFLDIGWSRVGARRLAVLTHGLEGNLDRSYMRGMARALNRTGWDVLSWNCRSCGDQMNRCLRFYHSGETGDLDTVIMHGLSSGEYDAAALIGFSLGGNMTVKYIGERGGDIDPRIIGGVGISVPCDLASTSRGLEKFENSIYRIWFLKSLKEKIRIKAATFPEELSVEGLDKVNTIWEFDDRYTSVIHGFETAENYYRVNSSVQFLKDIRVPTLIVNAKNDPLLSNVCFPLMEANANPDVFLETPRWGGHVGFASVNDDVYWSEARAAEFLESISRYTSTDGAARIR